MQISREFAGAERVFRLSFGAVMDLEEACGRTGIGAIYKGLATHDYRAKWVFEVLRLGLIHGGMPIEEAKVLVRERLDTGGWVACVSIAVDLLISLMEGVADAPQKGADPATAIDQGAVFAALIQLGLSPDQVRAMRFADYVNLLAASGANGTAPPSEAEFEEMMVRFENGEFDAARFGPTGTVAK